MTGIVIPPCAECGGLTIVEEEPMWVCYTWRLAADGGNAEPDGPGEPKANIDTLDSIWRCGGCGADHPGPV